MLSRVIRHTNEKSTNPQLWYQEALQLHSVLEAFTAAVMQELQHINQDPTAFGGFLNLLPIIGLCYSAQLNLYDAHTCAEADNTSGVGIPEQLEIQRVALNSIKKVCFSVSDLASRINGIVDSDESKTLSPLATDCLYQAGKYILWYIQETSKLELMTLVKEIKDALDKISRFWTVASKCLARTNR